MQNKKSIYAAFAGGLFLVLLVSLLFYLFNNKPDVVNEKEEDTTYQVVAESGDAVLMADTGLNVEWLVSEEDGRRQVFERFRVINKSQFKNFTGTEAQVDSIDITEENAEVFLTYPDGSREEITADNPYVLFSIYPPEPSGAYRLDVKLDSGSEYNFDFELKQAKEVEFIDTGNIQKVQIPPEENHDILERSEVDLHAYALGNLDLSEAPKVFHITPRNSAYGGSLKEVREKAGIGEYFWIDTEILKENYDLHQETMQELQEKDREELTPSELDYLERAERPITFEHIFLAKMDGVWYYAVVEYPKDF